MTWKSPFRRSSLSSRIHGVPEGNGVGLDVGVGFHVRVDMVITVRAVVVGILEVGGLVRDRPVEWGSEDAPAVFTRLHVVDRLSYCALFVMMSISRRG